MRTRKKQFNKRERKSRKLNKSNETAPLKACYNSPYGTYKNKDLTHPYELGALLYEEVDKHGTPSGKPIGTLMLQAANAPSHNPNKSTVSLISFFSFYNKIKTFGTIQGAACYQIPLNSHGIFQDGDFTFKITHATDDYAYLLPFSGKFAELKVSVKHGVRTVKIPSEKEFKTGAPKEVKITSENIPNLFEPAFYYKNFKSTYNTQEEHIHEYFVDTVLYSNKEDILKMRLGENIGHFLMTSLSINSVVDDVRKDSVFFIFYAINAGPEKRGNVLVIYPNVNLPLSQYGTWASIPLDDIHIGYVKYADGYYSYLNPVNSVYKQSTTTIDRATLIRCVHFPKKPDKFPSNIEIANTFTTHAAFYTGVPTILGATLSENTRESKFSAGAVIPETQNLKQELGYRKFSLYADVYDLKTKKYIGIGLSSYYSSYINAHPITLCNFSISFNDGTFLFCSTITNDELQANGAIKETTAANLFFTLNAWSKNYGNITAILRKSVSSGNSDTSHVIRQYVVCKAGKDTVKEVASTALLSPKPEEKPTESKSTESKSAESKPEESKSTETKPEETKSTETKPEKKETKPEEKETKPEEKEEPKIKKIKDTKKNKIK